MLEIHKHVLTSALHYFWVNFLIPTFDTGCDAYCWKLSPKTNLD